MKFHLIKKDIKHAYIEVLDEGNVELRIPKHFTPAMIENLVEEKSTWIKKKQKEIQGMKKRHASFLNGQTLYFLGEVYSLEGFNHSFPDAAIATWEEGLNYLMYELAEETFKERTQLICNELSIERPILNLRKMTKRWGTCYPKRQKIILNRKLIFVPKEALDLVIIHELTHFSYPHHQKEFYQALKKHLPDYQRREQILSDYRFVLDFEEGQDASL